jgi:hypothetical protein
VFSPYLGTPPSEPEEPPDLPGLQHRRRRYVERGPGARRRTLLGG